MSVFRKLTVAQFDTNIVRATKLVTEPLNDPKPDEVRFKVLYVGINALDLVTASGLIFVASDPPFAFGSEAIVAVDKLGPGVTSVQVGSYGLIWAFNAGAYAEYIYAKPERMIPLSQPKPEYLGLAICGLTALIGLKHSGHPEPGETVVVTAAAGGTGHLAVQIAKSMGCHVIGLCSSQAKKTFLTNLGCDRVINYVEEELDKTLDQNYPSGIDVVWETIGGKVLQTLYERLAFKGRLIVAGDISTYKTKTPEPTLIDANGILMKGVSINGFRVDVYEDFHSEYLKELVNKVDENKLRVYRDDGSRDGGKVFHGIEDVPRAIVLEKKYG